MNTTQDDFRTLLTGGDLTRPYIIRTKGGKQYEVTEGSDLFISAAYPSTVILCLPRQGISLINLRSIESVQCEHEVLSI